MVDAGGAIADLVVGNVEIVCEFMRRALHGMAQADLAYRWVLRGDRPGVDRHRVYILQQDGVRTDRQHILADAPQMRHRPEAAHDAADAQRVGDRLAKSVPLGDVEIGDRCRLVATYLEGNDHEIGAVERGALVGRGRDGRRDSERRDQLVGDDRQFRQPLFVDVHEHQPRAGERRSLQQICHEVLHEDGRTRANERDFRIGSHVILSN